MLLGNLTLILNQNICNKNCPFCIAKYSGKSYNKTINDNIEFDNLDDIFSKLRKNNIRFNRLVISGNGEPSLYEFDKLSLLVKIIKKYYNLFNGIRLHTSGNIFFNDIIFNLFNDIDNIEFNIMRLSLDSDIDIKILRYGKDYTITKNFKAAKKIKLDICLTTYLDSKNIISDVFEYLNNHNNIKVVRFKELLSSKIKNEQNDWINNNKLSKEDINNVINEIKSRCKYIKKINNKFYYNYNGCEIIYGESGNYKYYNNDYLISNERFMNYNEEVIDIEHIKKYD